MTSRVLDVLGQRFGLNGVEVAPLGGEVDQNTAVVLDDGSRVVVKISRRDRAHITWQHELIRLAGGALGPVRVPTVRTALDGGSVVDTRDGHVVTVQSWLDGRTLAELNEHAPELLEELGATAARMVRALEPAPGPPGPATHHWAALRAPEAVAEGIDSVDDPLRRGEVARIMSWFSRAVDPVRASLPEAVVHQDLNDFNVLARRDPDGRHHVHAVLDFGDALRTARVAELAVAVAYAMLRKANPLAAAAAVVRGYTSEGDLTDAELAVLFPMAAARLCVNAVTWSHRRTGYGHERMRHTWPAIAALAATPPELAEAMLREAAGRTDAVVDVPASDARCAVPGLIPVPLEGSLDSAGGARLGRHLEADERTPVRRSTAGGESATLRLGLAIESPEAFAVRTPFDAVVESSGAAVVVLRHDRPGLDTVWSRWTGVFTPRADGDPVVAGGLIGHAERAVRVAVFRSGETATMATSGLVPASEAAAWARVSPDPAEFAGLPEARRPAPDTVWDADRVTASRSVHFAQSQRSYYRRPMNLVGGRGAWLYDEVGAWLPRRHEQRHPRRPRQPPRRGRGDGSSCDPLNTNSRFVYAGIAGYAERLAGDASRTRSRSCSSFAAAARPTTSRSASRGRSPDGATSWWSTARTTATPPPSPGSAPTGTRARAARGRTRRPHEVEQPNRYRGRHGYDDPEPGTPTPRTSGARSPACPHRTHRRPRSSPSR